MATYVEVDAALDAIANKIASGRSRFDRAKARMQEISVELGNIPTDFSEELAEIDGFTPTGEVETLAKDRKAKYAQEFLALRAEINALIASF